MCFQWIPAVEKTSGFQAWGPSQSLPLSLSSPLLRASHHHLCSSPFLCHWDCKEVLFSCLYPWRRRQRNSALRRRAAGGSGLRPQPPNLNCWLICLKNREVGTKQNKPQGHRQIDRETHMEETEGRKDRGRKGRRKGITFKRNYWK